MGVKKSKKNGVGANTRSGIRKWGLRKCRDGKGEEQKEEGDTIDVRIHGAQIEQELNSCGLKMEK